MKVSAPAKGDKKPFYKLMRAGVNGILDKTNASIQFASVLFFLRTLLVLAFFLDTEVFDPKNPFTVIITILEWVLPSNAMSEFNVPVTIAFIAAPAAILVVIFLVILMVGSGKLAGNGLGFAGLAIYFYQNVLVFWFIGQQTAYLVMPASFTGPLVMVMDVLMAVVIALEVGTLVVLSLTFVNFNIRRKDALARDPSIHFLIFDLLLLVNAFVDPLPVSWNNLAQLVFAFLNYAFQMYVYYFRYPFHSFRTRKVGFFFGKAVFVLTFLAFFVEVWPVALISDNYVACLLVILILLVALEFIYPNDSVLERPLEDSLKHGSALLRAHVMAIYSLVKSSKSDKADELALLSIFYQHIKRCNSPFCLCQSRELCYDVKKEKACNLELPIWKDPVYLKSFVWSLLYQSVQDPKADITVHLCFMFFSLEKMAKMVLMVVQLKAYAKKVTGLANLGYRFGIKSMRDRLIVIIRNRTKDSPYARNDFEQLICYDTLMNQLK